MSSIEDRVLDGLRSWRPFRLLVVGDFMLDQALCGDAERLSPDAPVPVLAVSDPSATVDTAGGAGNVAVFAAALGASVACIGVVGDDHEGRLLRAVLEKGRCDTSGLAVDPTRPTITKKSLIGRAQHRHPQKMFRIDVESSAPLDVSINARIMQLVVANLDGCDVVCLEDYAKGVCTPHLCAALIDLCRARKIPVLVDPAAITDYARYRGATAITPNRTEAARATGRTIDPTRVVEETKKMSSTLLERLDLEAVVITLDRWGAVLEVKGSPPVHVPTVARQVYDVAGAGDMVLAVLAGAVANGMEWEEGTALANIAAGMEIEVFGVRAFSIAEIQAQVMRLARASAGKIRSRADLLVEISAHKAAGCRIVLTNGCFDVLHAGHVGYLREAKGLGDILVVGVNCDAQVRALKGANRPIYSQEDRAELLGELTSVDYVTVFDEPTAAQLLRAVAPAVYVKGGDYEGKEIAELAVVKELGTKIFLLGHRPGLSTTSVVERVRAELVDGGNLAES
ncbi:MAG: bifunctional heptose 7-phosphate kinase/heptose 1-phosphate adenyltransferase [Phycisphaerales bacterium]|nr:bifunctional heptose 7-phosphate kinase/heptose 1-phosphate adenyltransferase [Phycisphaerales bacterium]